MKDAEIKNALECCKYEYDTKCELCCYNIYSKTGCRSELRRNALDLINRQQAEIERLKYNLEAVLNERADHSEAIKEYKNKVKNDIVILFGKSNCTEFIECLDYRYKEMVGDAQ